MINSVNKKVIKIILVLSVLYLVQLMVVGWFGLNNYGSRNFDEVSAVIKKGYPAPMSLIPGVGLVAMLIPFQYYVKFESEGYRPGIYTIDCIEDCELEKLSASLSEADGVIHILHKNNFIICKLVPAQAVEAVPVQAQPGVDSSKRKDGEDAP
jgi:hypothetical protein